MLYKSVIVIIFILFSSTIGSLRREGAQYHYDSKKDIPRGRLSLYASVGKLVEFSPRGTSTCTATIIGPRTLLTAAHCYDPTSLHTFIDSKSRPWTVVDGYKGSEDSHITDIAVLYIEYPIYDIKPQAINTGRVAPNHQLVLAGYGCKSISIVDGSAVCSGDNYLRENYVLSDLYNDTDGSADGIYITPGDSGGALVDRQTGAIVGIASRFSMRLTSRGFAYKQAHFAPIPTKTIYPIIIR